MRRRKRRTLFNVYRGEKNRYSKRGEKSGERTAPTTVRPFSRDRPETENRREPAKDNDKGKKTILQANQDKKIGQRIIWGRKRTECKKQAVLPIVRLPRAVARTRGIWAKCHRLWVREGCIQQDRDQEDTVWELWAYPRHHTGLHHPVLYIQPVLCAADTGRVLCKSADSRKDMPALQYYTVHAVPVERKIWGGKRNLAGGIGNSGADRGGIYLLAGGDS